MNTTSEYIGRIPKKMLIIISGAVFYAYQSILRVAPNVMNADWMLHFHIDANDLGFMISFYYWSYASIQIPLGVLLDRFGARRLMVLASFLCASSCFIIAATDSVTVASIAMFIMGLGSACAFLGSVKLGTTWFTTDELVKIVAFVIVMGSVGSAIGGRPLNMLTDYMGWQATMCLLGVMGLFVCGFVYLTIGRALEPKTHETPENVLDGIKQVVRRPQAWLIAMYGMFMYSPIIIYGTSWGIPFVNSMPDIPDGMAAWVLTSMVVGAAIGSPIFAFYSDRISQRVRPMILGAFLGLIIELIVVFASGLSITSLFILFFLVGFCYTAKTLSFTAVCEIMPKSYSGVAVGFLNTLAMGAGTIFHPLIGKLLVFHWDGTMVGSAPLYSEWDYRFALCVLPICLGAALILMFFIKETHHAAEKQPEMVE